MNFNWHAIFLLQFISLRATKNIPLYRASVRARIRVFVMIYSDLFISNRIIYCTLEWI